jgi:glycosyltransferase involved in cell wall biosynthesis
MRIAQICPRYYPDLGGVETYVKEISERLNGGNYKIDVLTTDPTEKLPRDEVISSVTVKRFKSYTPSNAYTFSPQLDGYLKKHSADYDILHAHQYHAFPALYASYAKRDNKLVFNTHFHGKGHTFFRNLLHIPYRFIGRGMLARSDRIVCVSKYEKELLLESFSLDECKVSIIPCGVDLSEFAGKKRRSEGFKRILTVTRLEKYKGVQYLIEALPSLGNDMVLEVVGKGPFREDLESLASRLGVRERVRFSQDLPREELIQRYIDSDLFVLVSRYEAYGIVVAEALASGTPCIVTNTSALSEWVDNRSCYGVAYPIDLEELSEKIQVAMASSYHRTDLPTWDGTAAKFAELYESL